MLSVQLGDWQTVAQSLSTALEIAPAYAHAHQYLAQLQCEAGNVRDGCARALLAAEIEPTSILGQLDVARAHALRGELDDYERVMSPLEAQPSYRFPTLQLRIRVATWFGHLDVPRTMMSDIRGDPLAGYNRIIIGYARSVLGDVTREEMDAYVTGLLTESFSPRLYVVICQLIAEVYAARGFHDESLRYLRRAADSVLTDLDWVDRCPLLKGVRELPGFAAVRKTLHQRVDSMWVL
jgi:serine/threonine-protein kinase